MEFYTEIMFKYDESLYFLFILCYILKKQKVGMKYNKLATVNQRNLDGRK